MIREFNLKVTRDNRTVSFVWDIDAGTVTGADSIEILGAMLESQRYGYVDIPPYPSTYDTYDPLHHADQFIAVLMSIGLKVPADLASEVPIVMDADVEDGILH